MGRKKICSSCGKIMESNGECDCRKKIEFKPKLYGDPMLGSYRWKQKREAIRNRDGHICQRCFIKYGEIVTRDLSVHHIKSRKDFPELAWDDRNLICICISCNSQLGTLNKLDFKWDQNKNIDIHL